MTPHAHTPAADDAVTTEIPRDQWEDTLNEFTEFNQETASRIEMISPGAGWQIIAEDKPLLAVTLDDEAGTPVVVIECGDTAGGSPAAFRHIVRDPKTIFIRQSDQAGWDALDIETRSEGKVIITVNPHPGRGDLGLHEAGRSEIRG
jgi:hypothetical protein